MFLKQKQHEISYIINRAGKMLENYTHSGEKQFEGYDRKPVIPVKSKFKWLHFLLTHLAGVV